MSGWNFHFLYIIGSTYILAKLVHFVSRGHLNTEIRKNTILQQNVQMWITTFLTDEYIRWSLQSNCAPYGRTVLVASEGLESLLDVVDWKTYQIEEKKSNSNLLPSC